MRPTERGVTLAEVLIALSILAMAMLALLSVCSTALRSNRKGTAEQTAMAVAERELSHAVQLAQSDSPAGARAQFWDADYPFPSMAFATGQTRVGSTVFHHAIYAVTLNDVATGVPIGAAALANRVKKVDIAVWWWSEGGTRQGYGNLVVHSNRLVSEQDLAP